jgi:hypothetical protein
VAVYLVGFAAAFICVAAVFLASSFSERPLFPASSFIESVRRAKAPGILAFIGAYFIAVLIAATLAGCLKGDMKDLVLLALGIYVFPAGLSALVGIKDAELGLYIAIFTYVAIALGGWFTRNILFLLVFCALLIANIASCAHHSVPCRGL